MLLLADKATKLDEARQLLVAVRDNGDALVKFRQMVTAQGGNGDQVDDPTLLPAAAYMGEVRAQQAGYLAGMDTEALGWTAVRLGAGRQTKSAPIDPAVGFVMRAHVGDFVRAGERIAVVHANSAAQLQEAAAAILSVLQWSREEVPPLPHVYETILG
jgi:pyrimidine-nucleoside phosphorylase